MPAKPAVSRPRHKTVVEESKNVSLARLQTLMRVDEMGSLIRAAGGLQTRADQFSKQLSELGQALGVELVTAAGGPARLTAEAGALAALSRDFFRQLDDFRAARPGGKRTYVIGAGESLLQWCVIPAIAALGRQYPDVTFKLRNLQNADIVLGLERRTIDFGLVRRESMREPLTCTRLGQVGYVLCVPRGLRPGTCLDGAREDRPALSEEQILGLLRDLPLAVHLENTYVQGELEAALSGRGLAPNIRVRCDSFPNAMAALHTGAFATLMIHFGNLASLPAHTTVVPLPFLDHTCREIFLVWTERLMRIRPEAGSLKKDLVRLLTWQDA